VPTWSLSSHRPPVLVPAHRRLDVDDIVKHWPSRSDPWYSQWETLARHLEVPMTLVALSLVTGCTEVGGFFDDLAGDAEEVVDDVEDVKDDVEDVKDDVEGLTNPLVAQALLIDIAEPDYEGFEVEDLSGFEIAPYVQLILADATEATDIESAPIVGMEPRLRVGDVSAVILEDLEDGTYYGDGEMGVTYRTGDRAELTIRIDNTPHKASVLLPSAPDELQIPLLHDTDTNLIVDFADYAYHQILCVVVNTETYEITYSNEPETPEELYYFSQDREVKRKFEIPARAFKDKAIYGIGFAGIHLSADDDLEEMNTALSAFMAGKFSFYPTTTDKPGQ